MKEEQQEACRSQIQTELDQLKHEHVLDKRKAVAEALALAKKQQQQAEQDQLGQQSVEQQIKFAQKQLLKHWRMRTQRPKIDQQAGQQQPESVNQQQRQSPSHQQPLEKQPSQHRLKKRPQEEWQQQATEPVQMPRARREQFDKQSLQKQQNLPQKEPDEQSLQKRQNVPQEPFDEQSLRERQNAPQPVEQSMQKERNARQQQFDERSLQKQQNLAQKQSDEQLLRERQSARQQQFDEHSFQQQQNFPQKQPDEEQSQRSKRQQRSAQRQTHMIRDAALQQTNNEPLATSSQQADRHVLQQNKPDPEHPLLIAQDVAQPKEPKADEQAHEKQHLDQQLGLSTQQWQQPEQQRPQEPLIFQVPVPPNVNSFKETADGQLVKPGIQAPLPNWKQRNTDVDRQQQFEQLQQDKLQEQLQPQKGLFFCCYISLVLFF